MSINAGELDHLVLGCYEHSIVPTKLIVGQEAYDKLVRDNRGDLIRQTYNMAIGSVYPSINIESYVALPDDPVRSCCLQVILDKDIDPNSFAVV